MTISKKGFWRIIAVCSYLFCIASFFAAIYVMQKQNIDIQKYLVILFPSLLSITLIYQLLFPLNLYSYAIWNYLFAIITLAIIYFIKKYETIASEMEISISKEVSPVKPEDLIRATDAVVCDLELEKK